MAEALVIAVAVVGYLAAGFAVAVVVAAIDRHTREDNVMLAAVMLLWPCALVVGGTLSLLAGAAIALERVGGPIGRAVRRVLRAQ